MAHADAVGHGCNSTREVFLRVLQYILSLTNHADLPIPPDDVLSLLASVSASSFPLDEHPLVTLCLVSDGLPGVFTAMVAIAVDEEFFRSTKLEDARDKYERGEENQHIRG